MIRAHRVNATAQDDTSPIVGWNIAPNIAYSVAVLPGPASCGILLYDDDGLAASGAALVGTEQPCILVPNGTTIGMVDTELGWHLLLTTDGTESARVIRIGPAVDLQDEIHPVYADDDLALVRATAAVDEAAHYVDDITATCPLGLGAGLGDVATVPIDGVAVVGQVESITWTATPDGTTEQAVIRRHVAIAPEAFVEPTPPTVANDTAATSNQTTVQGDVLANDDSGLTVVAVNGLAANVGQAVDGDNGGTFTISASGAWVFDPDGDFDLLTILETATTTIMYNASDGIAEAVGLLTVTVSRANTAPVAVNDTGYTLANETVSGNVLTSATDAEDDPLVVSQVGGSAANVGQSVSGSNGGLFTISSAGEWAFDPGTDFFEVPVGDTTQTSITYHISDQVAESGAEITVTVEGAPMGISLVTSSFVVASALNAPQTLTLPAGIEPGDLVVISNACPTDSSNRDLYVTGYTEIADAYVYESVSTQMGAFYKVMGDPVDTEAVGNGIFQSGLYRMVYQILVFSGVDVTNPLDVVSTLATGQNSPIPNPPAITPTTDGSLVLSLVASGLKLDTGAVPEMTVTPPSGLDLLSWNASKHTSATYGIGIGAASKDWGISDGTLDPGSWAGMVTTVTNNCSWIALTLALRPA